MQLSAPAVRIFGIWSAALLRCAGKKEYKPPFRQYELEFLKSRRAELANKMPIDALAPSKSHFLLNHHQLAG
jgi:hypothetical protein